MAFGNLEQGTHSAPMADINTTPMVDVMLVLLIIFMVCTPLITQSVNVNLPKTTGTAIEQKPAVVQLAIDKEGHIRWNGDTTDDGMLVQKLSLSALQQPQPDMQLSADKDVRYERVAQVMAQVQAAGINRLGFVMLAGSEGTTHE
ncbi:MAG TPA: biopolymer transporter ExbD [Pseudomonadales bacterium]|nr:biopolymer transporter ExbD [Pseudomonadales bacterium]